ncbi:TetR/AcrR family transcriptional regulator [Gemelliphila palaticanis]|uniref:TetR/AcrR family transcriptional regulator n=1 Tax=Gemelliphila palaticanis TaxID=81950 RepID=A0ABX2T1W4_9BACL|nr:TetR/AcrR family transcriptional regulator [Gemella palaticanis]MBF0715708.1 TetR/AcrR family transcriptional regulator [Gemella palaticanis]NYS47638.1 TetR/AcrR family transcriptional regulator [Gemella palaticanis]
MTLNNKSRENIIKHSTKLIQIHGYNETSIQDIIEKSKAPKGSLYYYFPKGKDDIVISALEKIDLEFTKKFKLAAKQCQSIECVLLALIDLFKNKEKNYGTPSFRMTLLALETIGQAPEVYEKCGEILLNWKNQLSIQLTNVGCEKILSEKVSEWFFTTLQGAICASVIHGDNEKMTLGEQSIKLITALPKEKLEEIFK